MKRVLAITGCFLAFASACLAQDIITLTDLQKIKAKVTEVTSEQVKFKYYDNLNGQTYVYQKKDVISIHYQNGQVVMFQSETPTSGSSLPSQNQSVLSQSQSAPTQNQNIPILNQYVSTTQFARTKWPYTSKDMLLRMRAEDYYLSERYRSGRGMSRSGNVFIVLGSIGCGIGVLLNNNPSLSNDLYAIGGLFLTIGIPLKIIGVSTKNKALNTYHILNYPSTQPASNLQLNLSGNGLGLAYKF
jgi:hypothetical protein